MPAKTGWAGRLPEAPGLRIPEEGSAPGRRHRLACREGAMGALARRGL